MVKRKENSLIKQILSKKSDLARLPQAGELIEGKIIKVSRMSILVDLGPFGIGIIYGGELRHNRALFKELKPGQTISALVIEPENEEGYVELSLQEALAEKSWSRLKEKMKQKETVVVKVIEANRGGLIIELEGIIGFLPVSQLASENYPRVEDGDKNKILSHLSGFVGQEIKARILSLDQKENKLIVSEKATKEDELQERLKHYKKNDIVEGTVSGIADFGAFIKFGDNLEGLAHISELDWQIIEHPRQVVKENQKIKAKIIDLNNNQVFLSLKAMKEDPWQKIKERYQPGQVIAGKVTKLSPFGAFVYTEEGIHGLIHVSEFAKHNQEMDQVIEVGKKYNFKIISLNPQEHKMSLGLVLGK